MLQISVDLARSTQPTQVGAYNCRRVRLVGVLPGEVQRLPEWLCERRVIATASAHLPSSMCPA